MKTLITGGHLTPALAVIDELKKRGGIEIIFVGRKFALDSEQTLSFEYQSIQKIGIKFIELKAGRLTRILSWQSILNFIKFPLGFFSAWKIIKREKPDFVLSFGGYIALPIAFVSWLMGVPVFTHEQTMVPGLTNRIISFLAKKIFISFPSSKKYFPVNKVVLSGNPLRRSIFKIEKKPWLIKKNKPVIYITGGSLGSHSLNVLIESIIKDLVKDYLVIHQAGETKEFQDYERLLRIKDKNYYLAKHFFDDEIGYIYSIADLVISRAGANTVSELIALRKPAILVPLPWSAAGEQKSHALWLKEKGVAEVFFQDDLIDDPSGRLYKLIVKTINNLSHYQKNFDQLKDFFKPNAAENIVNEILA